MKILSELLEDVKVLESHGNLEAHVSSVSLNSKNIEPRSVFVALIGNVLDGHSFIDEVIEMGATVIVHEKDIEDLKAGITYIKVADTHSAVGIIASNFYNNPSQKMKLVGVTGTSGKTTTATLLHQLFRDLGYKAGLIGTVVNKINDISEEAHRTTPDAVTLNELLARMVDDGCEYCFMEVSSHSVCEGRVSGLHFVGGIFTNLSLDHLDYHKTMENYCDAKKGFFDTLPATGFAIANIDDDKGEYMLSTTKARKYRFSLKKEVDFNERFESKLIGEFNAYNLLGIYAVAMLLGQDKEKVKEIIKNLEAVPGRFQYFKSENGITGIVDYAHKPDALENVLRTANDMKGKGKLITVVGCGGDRDKSKRPIMARIGYDMSNILILTSDNPRTEKPEDILEDMKKGIEELYFEGKVYIITDRGDAIEKACNLASSGDFILVAGKGHENYQEVNGVQTHFDDMEEIKKEFEINRITHINRCSYMQNYKQQFKGKKITVMGLGLIGRGVGVTKFLAECGADLIVTDLKTKEQLKASVEVIKNYELKIKNKNKIKFVLGEHRLEDFKGRDMVIKATGVPFDSIYIEEARKNGISIEMDVSLFAKCAPEVMIIGVTGTRGKSMTTTLIYEILKANASSIKIMDGQGKILKNRSVYVGGNLRGLTTLSLLKKVKKGDILVCELDSWMLQGFGEAKISPSISVFTTFMPDHMNYYKNDMDKYFGDKANIFKYQKKDDTLVILPEMKKWIKKEDIKSKLIIADKKEIDTWKFNVKGDHHRNNLACAVKVAEVLGIPEIKIKKVVSKFKGLEGRLQLLKTYKGIKIYNDNNATTPEATIAGIEALATSARQGLAEKKIVLICGGADKGLNLDNFVKTINANCKSVIMVPGTGTDRLVSSNKFLVASQIGRDLNDITKSALSQAKKGDIILFSPAFASFGMFNNEYERNDLFMKIIKKLK